MDYLAVSPATGSVLFGLVQKCEERSRGLQSASPKSSVFFFFFRPSNTFVLSNVRARPMHDAVFSRRSTRWLEFYIR